MGEGVGTGKVEEGIILNGAAGCMAMWSSPTFIAYVLIFNQKPFVHTLRVAFSSFTKCRKKVRVLIHTSWKYEHYHGPNVVFITQLLFAYT